MGNLHKKIGSQKSKLFLFKVKGTGDNNLIPHLPIRIFYIILPHNLISVIKLGSELLVNLTSIAPKYGEVVKHFSPLG
jgi:hypothetical protein